MPDVKKYDFSNMGICTPACTRIRTHYMYFEEQESRTFSSLPFFTMCEYAHAMETGPGDLEDYFELTTDMMECVAASS